MKRTETRACFAPARGEPAALPARRSQQDAPPRRPRIRSPVSYRRSRFSALISKISSNRQVITRKMLVLLCGKRLYFRKDYQELLKAAVTHTSTSDRASREPDGFGTRPGDGSGCDEE
ncbi:putative sensor kinase protein [Burkholderia pseudomallei]|nr:putative sensor kinase protein [Burkholderia pseudomallei]